MEFSQEYIQYTFTAIIGIFVVSGFLIGFIRGSKRSLMRLAWLIITAVIAIVLTPHITPLLMEVDVSFLNLSYNGTAASTLKEFLTLSLSGALNASPEALSGTIDYALALVSMALNGIIFAVIFFGLKYVTLILYKIFVLIFIHDKHKPKGRLIGSLVGCVSGALVALTVLVPVAGYVSLYDSVYEGLGSEYSSSFSQADDIVSVYKNDTMVSLVRKIGLEKLQIDIFNSVSTAKYGSMTFSLVEEKNEIINAVPALIALGNAATSENPDVDIIISSFATLLDSNIVYVGIQELSPVFKQLIDNADFGDGTGAAEIKSVLTDVIVNIADLEKNKVKSGLSSMASVLSGITGLSNPTAESLESIGNGLDELIESGLVSATKIAALSATAAQTLFDGVQSDSDMYDTVQTIINDLKDGVTSYKTELGAAGSLYEALSLIDADDFAFEKDAGKLGAQINTALEYRAEIINKDLVDSFLKTAIDGVTSDLWGEFEESVEAIKGNLKNVNDYETEFEYVEKLIALAKEDFSIENIDAEDENGLSLGKRLDEIAPSVLVGNVPLDVIRKELDKYAEENTTYSDIFDKVKTNFADVSENSAANGNRDGYTYEQITNAFAELYAMVSDSEKMITGKESFSRDIAELYEEKLDALTDNVLMRQNATRALAAYITNEVKVNIKSLIPSGISATDSIDKKIDLYVDYLNRTSNLNDEPYTSETELFMNALGVKVSADNGTRVNKPFTYFCELVDDLVHSYTVSL